MKTEPDVSHNISAATKLAVYSAFGIFVFFVPISVANVKTIPLDHIVAAVRSHLPRLAAVYAMAVVGLGGIMSFTSGVWRKNLVAAMFAVLKAVGVVAAIAYTTGLGPAWYFEKDMAPFLFEKLVVPVGIIVPVGAIFLAFLVEFGLLEFVGVLMQPVMRPVWKTPGRSAVDAMASFVGSYSIGLLITNRVYKEGRYTAKEAAIIATGFSTVSATFMVIVAKTAGLMEMWNFYFWSTLMITFVVTAITVRLSPLREKPGRSDAQAEIPPGGNLLSRAAAAGLAGLNAAPPLFTAVWQNLRDGFRMAMGILPSIMSVGLIGLILAKYTPVFDLAAYMFWPVARLLNLPDAMLVAKATAVGIAEMFLPALLAAEAAALTRYVVAVVSVSSILFFSASIPCIMATEIPVSVPEMVVIWAERAILSLLLAATAGWLFL